jgi:hypothetical protein
MALGTDIGHLSEIPAAEIKNIRDLDNDPYKEQPPDPSGDPQDDGGPLQDAQRQSGEHH